MPASYVPSDAENIVDYGANSDATDPSLSNAENNLSAIQDAASAAGANGSIYIPPGTFYFGSDSVGNETNFGGREPRGISIYGDGPDTSVLAQSGHPDSQLNRNAFRWSDGYNHGTVTVRGLEFDGNAANMPNFYERGGGANAFFFKGSGTVDAQEVYVHDTYDSGMWCSNDGGTIKWCTFEYIAIQRENDAAAGGDAKVDHATKCHISGGSLLTIERCLFQTISGNCTNQDSGDCQIKWSYADGYGTQWNKLTRDNFYMDNTFLRANTAEQETAVSWDTPDGFVGRYGPFRVFDGSNPVAELNHVEIHDTMGAAMLVLEGNNSSDVTLQNSDMIAIHTPCLESSAKNSTAAFVSKNGYEFTNTDINRLSVHGSGGAVFDTAGSDGTIQELRRDNNTDGLGSTGITIQSDNPGTTPFQPDVPGKSEVGAFGSESAGPGVTTGSATDIQEHQVTLNGDLNDLAGNTSVDCYFQWRGATRTTWNTTPVQTLSSVGSFSDTITSLSKETEYEFRAVAEGDGGTNTGSTVQFTTAFNDPEETHQTNFSGMALGNIPSGWTSRWNSSDSDWIIDDTNPQEGDRTLTYSRGGGARAGISWEDIPDSQDVEILGLVQATSFDTNLEAWARLVARGSGGDSTESGYMSEMRSDGWVIRSYNDGNTSEIASNTDAPIAGNWYWTRFRVEGDQLKLRHWDYGVTEPSTWDLTATDSTIETSGWTGLGQYADTEGWWDWVSVGTGGLSAPEPLTVTEGNKLTVEYKATNTGDASGTQTITMSKNGTVVDEDLDITLSSGASHNGILEWQTSAGDAGSWTITVESNDTSDTIDINVEQ